MSAQPTTTTATNQPQSQKTELGLLEEDDEFEEFEAEDWNESAKETEDAEANLWEDNWDDDNIEDDFTIQLRNELEKRGQKLEM
ncbi:26S proteasome complex subunit DSS1 [Brachionus plicatilis]|uniref:26S proteasome complex subunit SEM1 n=1 Tax=Brachionus plicatilis TaxID=10195 RepID=A0A3M7TB81_BRAPC|nr:26S proteasome complex subunit DSS1 [Brachionus plicatilis]